jgi:hypothetical protein
VGDRSVRVFASFLLVAGVCASGLPNASAATHGPLAQGALVGDPRQDVGAAVDAGVVYVFPFSQLGAVDYTAVGSIVISEATIHVTPSGGDLFGASVLQADTNSDGINDLIIGAPGRNHGAGVVFVIRATSNATTFDFAHPVTLQQGTGGIGGSSEPGDHFGTTLLRGTPYNVAWLAIGVPGEDVGTVADAGDVVVMPMMLSGTPSITVYPGHGAPGTPQAGDRFGSSLARVLYGLAIGLPGHTVGTATNAGQVDVLWPGLSGSGFPGQGANTVVIQGANGVPGKHATGNGFGSVLTEGTAGNLIVGAPNEDVQGVVDVGTVTTVPLAGLGSYGEYSPGVGGMPGHLQTNAHFGAALFGPGDLTFFAGAPGATVGGAAGAGQVYSFSLNPGTLHYDAAHTAVFDETALHQAATKGDGFGTSIGDASAFGNGPPIAFGLPHKAVSGITDVGEVVFASSYTPGVAMVVQAFVQGRGGVPGTAEAGDQMGRALAAD